MMRPGTDISGRKGGPPKNMGMMGIVIITAPRVRLRISPPSNVRANAEAIVMERPTRTPFNKPLMGMFMAMMSDAAATSRPDAAVIFVYLLSLCLRGESSRGSSCTVSLPTLGGTWVVSACMGSFTRMKITAETTVIKIPVIGNGGGRPRIIEVAKIPAPAMAVILEYFLFFPVPRCGSVTFVGSASGSCAEIVCPQ